MKNHTVYTHDLLVRTNLRYHNERKKTIKKGVYPLAIFGVTPILLDIFIDNCHIAFVGTFFLGLLVILLATLKNMSKSKINDVVAKSLESVPCHINDYEFTDSEIKIASTNTYGQAALSCSYGFLSETVKLDDKSFYFVLKSGIVYPVYDENGIKEMFSYVCSRKMKYDNMN